MGQSMSKPQFRLEFYHIEEIEVNKTAWICSDITFIRILFFNFSETFFLKCTCTRTHDNINLFLRETRNVENRKHFYFYLL
jgi:hypothetical protein